MYNVSAPQVGLIRFLSSGASKTLSIRLVCEDIALRLPAQMYDSNVLAETLAPLFLFQSGVQYSEGKVGRHDVLCSDVGFSIAP